MNGNSASISNSALGPLLFLKKRFGFTPYVATHIQRWCSCWLIFFLLSAGSAFVLGFVEQISLLGFIFPVFALQGLVAEYRGVRVGASSICIPFRPFPRLPMFAFWSKRILLREIRSITVKAPFFGVETAVVRTHSSHNIYVYFSGRESRLWFLYFVEELEPQIIIYRRR